jgi:hypothetical protein
MSQTSDRLISRLNGAADSGSEGGLNSLGGGIKKGYSVSLSDLTANVEADFEAGGLKIEVFTVSGKWSSSVFKDEYAAGVRIDRKWGSDKRPFGTFSIRAKAVDGGVTADVITDVDNFQDEPNAYAADKTTALIKRIINNLVNP